MTTTPGGRIGNVIPAIEGVQDQAVVRILTPIKQILDDMSGHSPKRGRIVKLGANANLAGLIDKVNEVIDRLQT
jgi:hypothetical protein